MSWTKLQLVEQAFNEIGLGTYEFDLQPEKYDSALRRLDAMIAKWGTVGIKLAFPLPTEPENSKLSEESNIPDSSAEAVYTNLAVRIAPTFGKVISQETKSAAKEGFDMLLLNATKPEVMQYPNTLPLGSGNKSWVNTGDPFVRDPETTVDFS